LQSQPFLHGELVALQGGVGFEEAEIAFPPLQFVGVQDGRRGAVLDKALVVQLGDGGRYVERRVRALLPERRLHLGRCPAAVQQREQRPHVALRILDLEHRAAQLHQHGVVDDVRRIRDLEFWLHCHRAISRRKDNRPARSVAIVATERTAFIDQLGRERPAMLVVCFFTRMRITSSPGSSERTSSQASERKPVESIRTNSKS
jgi:hypothetical protein